MTHSKLTNRIHLAPASQHSSRNGTTVDTFLIHHQASTNSAATESAMVNATKDVSANYIITNEGELVLIVDEDRRAHTSGSRYDGGRGAQWDRRSITVEIENETGAPDWKISEKAIQKAARLLVDLRRRRKVTNALGHRDLWERFRASYPTFCPGPDTVAKIVNAADALTKGGTSTPAAAPAKTTAQVSKPATTTGTTTPVIDLGKDSDMNYIIRSKNRPHAAILGGEYKRLANSEELAIVQKLTPVTILDKMNDREYDVLRAIATRGSGVTKSEVQAIVDKLAKKGVTVSADIDLDAIADAVNDEAAARLAS